MIRDELFLNICNEVAKNSKCLSRHIGAVLVKGDTIVSVGYNGPPRGVPHCGVRHKYDESLRKEYVEKDILEVGDLIYGYSDKITFDKCPRQLLGYKSGEGLEWCVAGHGERNALINAARNGISTVGTKMFMNCSVPCTPCLIEIINAGVEEIIVTDFNFYDQSAKYLIETSKLIIRRYGGRRYKK